MPAALFALDWLTGSSSILATLYVAGPLLAAVRCGRGVTAAIGALAVALALVMVVADGEHGGTQDVVRVATVAVGSALAVVLASLRSRLERAGDRYETLLQALSEVGEGMVVLEGERCVYANPAFERISGYGFAELQAMGSVFELVEPDARDEARRRAIARTEEGLVDPTYRLGLRRRDGGVAELELAGVPSTAAGRRQLVVVVRDVTARRRADEERERLHARSDLLAEASALFDQTLDQERTMRAVAALSMRELADACVVAVADAPGTAGRMTALARDPERQRRLADVQAHDLGVRQHGRAHPPPRGPDGAAGELLRALGLDETITVPLQRPRARPGHGDARLRADRAVRPRRPARAVRGPRPARGAGARQRPPLRGAHGGGAHAPALAAAAGAAVDPRHADRRPLPRRRRGQRGRRRLLRLLRHRRRRLGGGDRRRLRQGRGGRRGDRAGAPHAARLGAAQPPPAHGPAPAQRGAAAPARSTTASARCSTPRSRRATAAARPPSWPPAGTRCRCCCAPTAGSSGRAAPGRCSGILDDPPISEERIELEPGDALILYTDGVTEASPVDDAFGPEQLERFVAGCAGRDAARIAEAIEREVLEAGGGRLRDDVAVLVVRVEQGGRAPFAAVGEGVAASS